MKEEIIDYLKKKMYFYFINYTTLNGIIMLYKYRVRQKDLPYFKRQLQINKQFNRTNLLNFLN